MPTQPLIIRADASSEIGTGHVMRCLALAQAWQDAGGGVTFLMAESTPAIEERVRREGMRVMQMTEEPGSARDATSVVMAARELGAAWAVVDGYRFNGEYQTALKEAGLKVLFVDDNGHADYYPSDLVLNQNAHASEGIYRNREASTRLLLGPRYALLRREFNQWRDWTREIPEVARKVLVTMGGSDPDNVTERVIHAVSSLPDVEARVAVGGSNPHRRKLRQAVDGLERLQLIENTSNMPELMAWADVAVTGAGSTAHELLLLGLPALLFPIADNQRLSAEALAKLGAALNLAHEEMADEAKLATRLRELIHEPHTRKSLSQRGRELVDGKGTRRIAGQMRAAGLKIRRATEADCKLLWQLANDPVVRASSFSPQPIAWDTHVAWYATKLAHPNCRILIGELDGAFVGQMRVDVENQHEGDVDISVMAEQRGAGVASELIRKGVRELFSTTGLLRINAYILPQNSASAGAFTNAGFRRVGEQVVRNQRAFHYVCEREATGKSGGENA